MQNLLLSVVTITYNNAEGLRKTLDSVAHQTWKEFEYIVIDGGSSDESGKYIEDYKKAISYSVSEKDKGIYNAMNKGIAKANGKYILFLNSGDFLLDENVLENIKGYLDSDKDFICGNLYYESGGKGIIKMHPDEMTFSYLVSKTVYHPSTFIKRTLFETYGLYNEENKIISDWEFFFKTMGLNGASYQKINHTITNYDMTGISSLHGEKVIAEKQNVYRKYLPYVFNNETDSYIFDKFRERNKRFKLLEKIDKSPFFRKIATLQLSVTEKLMKIFDKRK